MNVTCKNCGHLFKGKFCSNCGQSAETGRLNYNSIWHDIRHGIFHLNDKLAFTTKQLFYRPGHAIRDYIEGKRLDYLEPISYLTIVGSAYILLHHYFPVNIITDSGDDQSIFSRLGYTQTNQWIISHYNQLMLSTVPLLALSTFIVFRKQAYNFVEHFVMSCFATAQRLLLLIFNLPILHLVDNTPYSESHKWLIIFIEFLLAFWIYSQFFQSLSKAKTFQLVLLSYSLFFVMLLGIIFISLTFIEKFIL